MGDFLKRSPFENLENNEQNFVFLPSNNRLTPRLFLFFISIFRENDFTKGNAKEQKLKTRRDGGKERKEGGGGILRISFGKIISSEDTDDEKK